MTCKDCIHYDACAELWYEGKEDFNIFAEKSFELEHNTHCDTFENKEDYVKLPCKIGCDAWEIIIGDNNKPFIHKTRVTGIYIGDDIWINTRSEDGLSMSYGIGNVGVKLLFDEATAEEIIKITNNE